MTLSRRSVSLIDIADQPGFERAHKPSKPEISQPNPPLSRPALRKSQWNRSQSMISLVTEGGGSGSGAESSRSYSSLLSPLSLSQENLFRMDRNGDLHPSLLRSPTPREDGEGFFDANPNTQEFKRRMKRLSSAPSIEEITEIWE